MVVADVFRLPRLWANVNVSCNVALFTSDRIAWIGFGYALLETETKRIPHT